MFTTIATVTKTTTSDSANNIKSNTYFFRFSDGEGKT